MIVAPCSARTLAAVAYCNSDNLLTRAVDVALKERRRLVLLVWEPPLSMGHLRAMTAATEMGAIVMPPVPRSTFARKPRRHRHPHGRPGSGPDRDRRTRLAPLGRTHGGLTRDALA
jgi:polyprenyl P-hydroxybenzoate/phenylacrylic acid decarboxylase-like protein